MTAIPPTCPDEVELERFIGGQLPGPGAERVRRHLAECGTCGAYVSAAFELETLVGELRESCGDRGSGASLAFEIPGLRPLRQIGEGGSSVVFEAEQASPRRRVAVKLLRSWRTCSPARREMFEREALSLAQLNHPSIAAVYAAGATAEGQPYIVMRLVQGPTLAEHAAAVGRAPGEIIPLLAQVADAVHYAHGRGVLHRDIKPANIIVPPEGPPVLIDFGLARIVGEYRRPESLFSAGRGVLGTLPYMAPEQVQGDPSRISPATDVYALGAVAFEALTGSPPLRLDRYTAAEAAMRVCTQPIPALASLAPGLAPHLAGAVDRALSKDPAARQPDAAAFAAELRSAPTPSTKPAPAPPRRGVWAAALLVSTGLAVWAALRPKSAPPVESTPPTASPPVVAPGLAIRDARLGGVPADPASVRWIWFYWYVEGDPAAVWRAERDRLLAPAPAADRGAGEKLLMAGCLAQAAGETEEALRLYASAAGAGGRWKLASRSLAALLVLRTRGPEAAAAGVADIERSLRAARREDSPIVAAAWLTLGEYYERAGSDAEARRAFGELETIRTQAPALPEWHWLDQLRRGR